MELKILGCGASTGVPQPACKCKVCLSKEPFNNRLRQSALLVTDCGQNILIDASPDLRIQALTHNIDHLDGVLFTHAHADHILGIDDLRCFNFVQPGKKIPLYGTENTFKHIRQTFSYLFELNPHYLGGPVAQLDLIEITPHKPFYIGQTKIQPLPLIHGKEDVIGFRFGSISYATDCNQIPDETRLLLAQTKTLIIDSLRYKPHATHFSIEQAIETARELGIEETFLTHLNHSIDYFTVSSQLPEGIKLAYDGLVITDNFPNATGWISPPSPKTCCDES